MSKNNNEQPAADQSVISSELAQKIREAQEQQESDRELIIDFVRYRVDGLARKVIVIDSGQAVEMNSEGFTMSDQEVAMAKALGINVETKTNAKVMAKVANTLQRVFREAQDNNPEKAANTAQARLLAEAVVDIYLESSTKALELAQAKLKEIPDDGSLESNQEELDQLNKKMDAYKQGTLKLTPSQYQALSFDRLSAESRVDNHPLKGARENVQSWE